MIEADNGIGWTRHHGSAALAIEPGRWETEVFGLTYRLEKFANPRGWCLYLGTSVNPHFHGEYCGPTVLDAIDVASYMITKADLRAEGHEKEEN
jgi:hypothetical protein